MTIPSFASILIVLCVVIDASANQINTARDVDAIQAKQEKSIETGISNGRLTPKEARQLYKEQNEIINMEIKMREDGVLSASELGELFAKLEYAQKHINQLTRNHISYYGHFEKTLIEYKK